MSNLGDILRITRAMTGAGDKELVGAILQDDSALETVAAVIEPRHIGDYKARTVYEVSLRLWKAGKPVRAESVAPLVASQDVTAEDILELLECTTGLHVDYYVRRVLDSWKAREFAYSARTVGEKLAAPECDVDEVIHGHIRELESLTSGQAVSDGHIGDHLLTLADEPETERLPTGLDDLDALLSGGFVPGQLIVIGARPSVGKTALAAGMVLSAAERSLPVLFLSFEMSSREMTERFLSQAGLQSLADADGVNRLSSRPLFLRESAGWSIDKVECEARRYSRRHGVRVLVVDYLSLVQPRDRRLPRHEQVADISHSLKRLALQCKLVVIAAQQLNREIEKRDSGRPRMSDFRDSGAVEQDADILIGLERPIRPDEGVITRGVLHLMKQRNGSPAELPVGFDPRRQRFYTTTQC
jgi:replicative DNA helicase